jgi:hypothetical protein
MGDRFGGGYLFLAQRQSAGDGRASAHSLPLLVRPRGVEENGLEREWKSPVAHGLALKQRALLCFLPA